VARAVVDLQELLREADKALSEHERAAQQAKSHKNTSSQSLEKIERYERFQSQWPNQLCMHQGFVFDPLAAAALVVRWLRRGA
jgi:hypothetical protein